MPSPTARTFDRRMKDAVRYAETAQWFIAQTLGAGSNGTFRFGASPLSSFSATPSGFVVVLASGAAVLAGIPVRTTGARSVTLVAVDEKHDGRYDIIGVNGEGQVVLRTGSVGADPSTTGIVKLWRVVRRSGETQVTATDNGTDAYLVDVREWVN